MLISKSIKIKIVKSNLNYYKRKDPNLNIGDVFEISISDLSKKSGLKVDVKCDYCGDEFKMEYRKYLRSIEILAKNSCKKSDCSSTKIKDSNLIQYGVSNVMQLSRVKEKAKKTNIEKYGTENPNILIWVKEKTKTTNRRKYGVDHPMILNEIKDKLKSSLIEKYGVDNVSKLKWVKEKIKKSIVEKYGTDNYTKTSEYKTKSKQTNLEKYGVDNYAKTGDYKLKTEKSNLEKWGFKILSHSEEFRKKNFDIANHPNYLRRLIDEKLNEFKCDCDKSHTFKIHSDNFYHRISLENPLCTECCPIGNSRSIKENLLYEFIQSVYSGNIIQSYRDIMEIDIYLPELNLGFEFNGLRWHSSLYKENNYHINKTNFFKERGIRIIHIWEDDFTNKTDIIKSQVKNLINVTDKKIYARKCVVKEIDIPKISKEFLDKNHIQGSVQSKLKIGLYFNDQLVSLMTFDIFEGRKKMPKNEWNLNRFCSQLNTNVVGGATKIFSYFLKKYNPKRIISYADKDWSDGNLYKKLGFSKVYDTNPDYKYLVNNQRTHKSNFRKSKTGISESVLDIPRIYNTGLIKYEINIIS